MPQEKTAKSRPILLIIGLVLLAYFGWSTSSTLVHSSQNKSRLSEVEQEVASLKDKKSQLEEKLKYQQSDLFVEQQARNQLGMAKAGETVVVFPQKEQALGESTSQSHEQVSPGRSLPGNLQAWSSIFLKF